MGQPWPGSPPPAARRRRLVGLLVCAIAGIAVLAALGWSWWSDRSKDGPTAATASATPSVTLSQARATELSEQISSGEEAEVRKALLLPTGAPLDPELVPGLAGLELDIETATYAATGVDSATVDARVTDASGASNTWVLDLVLVDGGWQVVGTRPDET